MNIQNQNYSQSMLTTESHGSMQNIVMEKRVLLNIIRDNKSAHDELLRVSRDGYLEMAKELLEKKKPEFSAALEDCSRKFYFELDRLLEKINKGDRLADNPKITVNLLFNNTLDLKYPEDHSKDYDRAIRKIELSVYDQISLSDQEFECYVLNNWDWKDTFLGLSATYGNHLSKIAKYNNDITLQRVSRVGVGNVFSNSLDSISRNEVI